MKHVIRLIAVVSIAALSIGLTDVATAAPTLKCHTHHGVQACKPRFWTVP